jgi:hypothetical protein
MRYELTIHFERCRRLPRWWHRHAFRLARWLPDGVTYLRLSCRTAEGEETDVTEFETGGVVGRRNNA